MSFRDTEPHHLPFISLAQCCRELGIARPTLDAWRAAGLPCYRIARRVLFDPAEVTDWIRKHPGDVNGSRKSRGTIAAARIAR